MTATVRLETVPMPSRHRPSGRRVGPHRPAANVHQLVTFLQARRPHLEGIAISLLRDGAAAQDAVSDTFEAILRVRPDLADDGAALAYARTAVVNRCRSMLRRRSTARQYLLRQTAEPLAPAADQPVLLADAQREILALFYRLPLRQREVLILRYFADLSDREIGQTLDMPASTVRSNASRGHATLTTLMKGCHHG